MAKTKSNPCCPKPFIIREIILGEDNTPANPSYLLQEDSFFLLQEDDGKIIL